MNPNGLRTEVVRIDELVASQKEGMFSLMKSYFDGVDQHMFDKDLAEKKWVVMLSDSDKGHVCGFSTLMIMEDIVENIPVRAFYSGDTIVDRKYWKLFSLERCWAPFVFSHVLSQPGMKWYWFVVCKGYRTFRYLPVYFYRFIPSKDQTASPFDATVLNSLAKKKFGASFDPQKGVVHCSMDYRLRAGVGDITEREMLDPNISFFSEKNSEWRNGSELACLAELSLENIKPIVVRMLNRRKIA